MCILNSKDWCTDEKNTLYLWDLSAPPGGSLKLEATVHFEDPVKYAGSPFETVDDRLHFDPITLCTTALLRYPLRIPMCVARPDHSLVDKLTDYYTGLSCSRIRKNKDVRSAL